MSFYKTSILCLHLFSLIVLHAQAGFVAGTLVKTIDGFIPIEELAVGDEVFTFDEQVDDFLLRTITDIVSHKVTQLIHINAQGYASNADIITDSKQPFYAPLQKNWCTAQDLKPGMLLQSCYEHEIVVSHVREIVQEATVYDLVIDEYHTFCVTGDGIVVHNLVIVMPITLGVAEVLKVVGVGVGPDKDGNIWIPTGPNGHGGPHWDVQISEDDYVNVYPNGHIRQGKRK